MAEALPNIYGIIPARQGSKGLPGKNKRRLGDDTLVGHACRQALGSRLGAVFLDTDDEELIADVRERFPRVRIPYVRPAALAGDRSTAVEVALHFLGWLEAQSEPLPHALCWLQPTSPLRTSADIDACLGLLGPHGSVVSMVDVGGRNPYKMKKVGADGRLEPLLPGTHEGNRQDLPQALITSGAVFVATVETLRRHRTFYGADCVPYMMPPERGVNIDDQLDFRLAELLWQEGKR